MRKSALVDNGVERNMVTSDNMHDSTGRFPVSVALSPSRPTDRIPSTIFDPIFFVSVC